MEETYTRLHFSIPASLKANSKDCSLALCLPIPLVKKIFLGTSHALLNSSDSSLVFFPLFGPAQWFRLP